MRMIAILAAAVTFPLAASAHDSSALPVVTYELPKACSDAAGAAEYSKPAAKQSGMPKMDKVQAANMGAMMRMDGPMMKATMIKDPDLAFNCGMIIHHQGGIAMSEVELRMGKDETSRETARMIIDAQAKEIKEMTARVEILARKGY